MPLILLILILLFGVSPDAQIQNILSAPNNGCDSQSWRENFVGARAFYGGEMKPINWGRANDLTGMRFGRLVAKKQVGKTIGGNLIWECLCDCGTLKSFSAANLKNGSTISCGCFRREFVRAKRTSHGHTKNGKRSIEYNSWACMRARCTNKKDPGYHNYGGRGIKVCDRWIKSFASFFKDMGFRPTPKHSLERIENDGDYKPSNCRWATVAEHAVNRRTNRLITVNGKTLCICQWADELGWPSYIIHNRLQLGWSDFDAVNTPVKKCRPR